MYTPQTANKKIVQITQGIHEKMRNIIPERYKYIINAAMIKPLTADIKSGAITDVCCRTSFLWCDETDGLERDTKIEVGIQKQYSRVPHTTGHQIKSLLATIWWHYRL